MRLAHATVFALSRLGGLTGLLPVLVTGGMVWVAVLAALGLWQLTWAVQQVSTTLDRERAAHAALAPAVSHLPAPPGGAVPTPAERAADAISVETVQPEPVASAPHARLEDPNPIPDVSPPVYSPPPACQNIYVYIVSISPRFPARSAASIAAGPSAPGRFRQIGQRIEEWEVTAIRDDWSGLNPEVWLSRGEQVCRAELAGNPKRVKYQPPVKKRKRPVKKRKRRRRRSR